MAPASSRRIILKQHLTSTVVPELFGVETFTLSALQPGEVRVKIGFVHIVTAYTDLMREDAEIPMPPFGIGGTVGGATIGTVVDSRHDQLTVGDTVLGFTGWQTYAQDSGDRFTKVDASAVPSPAYYLNQGVTAYHGVVDVAHVHSGDVVFVSGAAGGVGSLAGQIAKLTGATKVIGTAGTDEKVDYLVHELGYDVGINYRTADVQQALKDAAPEGISVFYDNVGGSQFEAAVQAAAPNARFALCGAVSSQVSKSSDLWPRFNLMTAITKNLSIFPFATHHTQEQVQAWSSHFGRWLRNGEMVFPHTALSGDLTGAPAALADLLAGKFTGNVTLELADNP